MYFASIQNSHLKKSKVQMFCEDYKTFENVSHFVIINSKFRQSTNHNDETLPKKDGIIRYSGRKFFKNE